MVFAGFMLHLNMFLNPIIKVIIRSNAKLSLRTYASSNQVRVRFAPSPTGYLHIGSLRTAFYNYLFARKHGGQFIVRIEDTDQTRTIPGAINALEEVLRWAGLSPDEGPTAGGPLGPYIQSERFDIYGNYAHQLVDSGHAYRCFCSDTRLSLIRKEATKNREIPKYDNRCRHLNAEQVATKLDAKDPYTIRLRLKEGDVVFDDVIYGKIAIDLSKTEADPILLKSDGFPTYHLANVVDDNLMKITHVLRGVEWQKSTPKHLMLYEAFGWQAPIYAHLPLIINSDGSKLSKRQDDARVEAMIEHGFSADAVVSYLTNIGGGFGKQVEDRIWSLSELASMFSLEKMSTAAAKLDPVKLKLYSRLSIAHKLKTCPEELVKELRQLLNSNFSESIISNFDDKYLEHVLDWSKDRIYFLKDLTLEFGFIWAQPKQDWNCDKLSKSLGQLDDILEDTVCLIDENTNQDFPFLGIVEVLKAFCTERKLSFGKYMQLLRLSTTGSLEGPPIHEILEILGPKRFCSYLEEASRYVGSNKQNQENV